MQKLNCKNLKIKNKNNEYSVTKYYPTHIKNGISYGISYMSEFRTF